MTSAALARTLAVDGRTARSAEVLPALAVVAAAGAGPVASTERLAVPGRLGAGRRTPGAARCWRAPGCWSPAPPGRRRSWPAWCAQALAGPGRDRAVELAAGEPGADELAAAVADRVAAVRRTGGRAGVVSLLALARRRGAPVVPAGLAGTLALVQALGDAGVAAPLWVLTRGAVAAGAG